MLCMGRIRAVVGFEGKVEGIMRVKAQERELMRMSCILHNSDSCCYIAIALNVSINFICHIDLFYFCLKESLDLE
jgi:hypothetical protein